jgi:hypothetical protein
MNSVPWLLAWRSLTDRPWRSALLLLGYGIGVAVMIALLSVGEALLSEARDRDLAAGGDAVLLPEGVDPAVLKVNGVTALFLTIPHAQFIVRQVLDGPRFLRDIEAAAPEVQNRVVYLKLRGRIIPANASGGIPSLDDATHAAQEVPGARDSAADRAWIDPPADALFNRIDRFHMPAANRRKAWAEWDYFTFSDPASGAYGYITLLAGGQGRGAVLVRLRRPGQPVDDVALPVRLHPDDLSTAAAAQQIGPARVWVRGGQYYIRIDDPRVHADLRLEPDPGFYLPPGETAEETVVSGYVVPVVRGRMTGGIRTAHTSLHLSGVSAYHDHNWGTWRGVTWEWGEASGAGGAVLYGALHLNGPGRAGAGGRVPALFAWGPGAQGRGGLLGVFPIRSISFAGWHPGPIVAGHRVQVPEEVVIVAGEGANVLHARVHVHDALGSIPVTADSPGGAGPPRRTDRPVFLQMRGTMDVRGAVDGRTLAWSGPAAAETFVLMSP